MPVLSNELQCFYAEHRNQANPANNGGRQSANAITSGLENNIWPRLTTPERLSGQTLAEKCFWQNMNARDESTIAPCIFLENPNTLGDYEYLVPGDDDGMQSGLSASARKYTASLLAADAAVGATTLQIILDNGALAGCYQPGDTLIIRQGTMSATSTTWELATLTSVSGTGDTLTLTLQAGLTKAYSVSAGACVCSCWHPSTALAPRIADVAQSGTGQFDTTNFPIAGTNRGTIRQNWTLTYTSATACEISGDTLGSLGTFDCTADIAPLNPATDAPYFIIPAGGHGSAHVAHDALTFKTYAAALAFWRFKITPAGSPGGDLANVSADIYCE